MKLNNGKLVDFEFKIIDLFNMIQEDSYQLLILNLEDGKTYISEVIKHEKTN